LPGAERPAVFGAAQQNVLALGMSQIVTLTFNPCIDKSASISGLAPEKKLRCSPPSFGPGGGGINVSRALKNLGKASLAIYPSGGFSGKFLDDLMEQEGLQVRTAETVNHTRENFIAFDTATGLQYRFGMPGNEISEGEWKALLSAVEDTDAAYIVASGSLLPGMPADILAQVAQIAQKKGARLILDTSGEALKKALDVGIYLLKPNLGELSSLVGQEEVHHDTVDIIGKEIINRGQCEVIVVSLGAKGAKMITREEVIHVPSPVVKSVSTVGAGDSMVAGMVLALSQNKSLKEVLQLGVACGTAATLTHGSELCRKEDVDRLYHCIIGAVEASPAEG
jgi:6-phosphofructokinase 2